MFDAMVNQRIDTQGFNFDIKMADIKELNDMAFNKELDVTKLSYHAYAYLREEYVLLHSGSALGSNCGPLLISREPIDPNTIKDLKVAIPGKHTTANLLFSLAYPEAHHKQEMLFHEIEDAVLSGEVDLGLIIHENRFTYQEKGLKKVLDLGEYWEGTYRLPIPLGGIVAKRSLGEKRIRQISQILSKSVQYAFDFPAQSAAFVQEHAQEMKPEVLNQHISLYVNQYSISLGETGRAAVNKLFDVATAKGVIKGSDLPIFIKQE
jgi:1,4-dihydroxy-6-naphthoate synthase